MNRTQMTITSCHMVTLEEAPLKETLWCNSTAVNIPYYHGNRHNVVSAVLSNHKRLAHNTPAFQTTMSSFICLPTYIQQMAGESICYLIALMDYPLWVYSPLTGSLKQKKHFDWLDVLCGMIQRRKKKWAKIKKLSLLRPAQSNVGCICIFIGCTSMVLNHAHPSIRIRMAYSWAADPWESNGKWVAHSLDVFQHI